MRVRVVTPNGVTATLAGSGVAGFADGFGTNAKFSSPRSVFVDPSDAFVYVGDYGTNRVRQINIATGQVSTLMGSGAAASVDGLGTSASIWQPCGVSTDSYGTVFAVDQLGYKIRKIGTSGWTTTVAGGRSGTGLGSGASTSATFAGLLDVKVDWLGQIFIAENNNNDIRKAVPPAQMQSVFSAPVCDGTRWHHVAATIDSGNSAALYVDGALVMKSAPFAVNSANGANVVLGVGGSPYSVENFLGKMSDMRFYNFALSAQQVAALAAPPLPVFANAVMTPAVPTGNASSYTFTCAPGYGGAGMQLVRSAADFTWSSVGAASVSCTQCAAGTYTATSGLVATCTPCPAGFIAAAAGSALCTPCAPASYAASATACASCAANTYSFGGTTACASCAAGEAFLGATLGCAPSTVTSPAIPGVAPAFYLSGQDSVSAFTVVNAAGLTFASDRFNTANAAINVSQGSYFYSAAVPSLPTGGSPRTYSAFVRCPPPLTAAGRTLMDIGDGGTSKFVEHFTLSAVATTTAASVNINAYTVTTLAGSLTSTAGFMNGQGTNALFNTPSGLAMDSLGNLYVGDRANHQVRLVTPQGFVTTVAGGLGSATSGATDAPGLGAGFNGLQGLCLDPTGTWLGVVDSQNNKIRKITLNGYVVSTYAGCAANTACAAYAVGTAPGPAIDGAGTNAKFSYPLHCAFDPAGNMYVSEYVATPMTNAVLVGAKIRMIYPNGTVTTLAGNGTWGIADGVGTSSMFSSVRGIAVDPVAMVLYAGDYGFNVVKAISIAPGPTFGQTRTIMGKAGSPNVATLDGTGTSATISEPCGIAVDPLGMVFATDQIGYRIRKISPGGITTTLAGQNNAAAAAAYQNGVGTNAYFNQLLALYADSAGNAFTGEGLTHAIRKVAPPARMASSISAPVCDGVAWHHLALTMDGVNTAQLYIDGALTATATPFAVDTANGNPSAVAFGGVPNGLGANLEPFAGQLADVKVYGQVLTGAQVAALSQPPLPTFPNAFSVPPGPVPGALAYVYTCAAGYAGPTVRYIKSTADNTWQVP